MKFLNNLHITKVSVSSVPKTDFVIVLPYLGVLVNEYVRARFLRLTKDILPQCST